MGVCPEKGVQPDFQLRLYSIAVRLGGANSLLLPPVASLRPPSPKSTWTTPPTFSAGNFTLLATVHSSHSLVSPSPVFSPPPSSYWPRSTAFSSCTRITASIKRNAIASACPILFCTALRITPDPSSRSMRRRHGIPDNDRRPFNVAYAAAKRAQKESEAEAKGVPRQGSSALSAVATQAAKQHVVAPTVQATRPRQATGAPPFSMRNPFHGNNDVFITHSSLGAALAGQGHGRNTSATFQLHRITANIWPDDYCERI